MKKQMKSIVKNRMIEIMSDIKIREIIETDIENGFLGNSRQFKKNKRSR